MKPPEAPTTNSYTLLDPKPEQLENWILAVIDGDYA